METTRNATTVEELLEQERCRALAGLKHGAENAGAELARALGYGVARNPWLTVAAGLLIGVASGPALLRGLRPSSALLGWATKRGLTLASLALGLSLRSIW